MCGTPRPQYTPRHQFEGFAMTPTVPTAQPVTYGHDASLAKFSLGRYQRMIETGILTPEDKDWLLRRSAEHRDTCPVARSSVSTMASVHMGGPSLVI